MPSISFTTLLVALLLCVFLVTAFATAGFAPMPVEQGLRWWIWQKTVGCEPQELEDFSCPPCKYIRAGNLPTGADFAQNVTVVRGDTLYVRATVSYSPRSNEIMVGFRGSRMADHAINWWEDFDLTQVQMPQCPASVSNCLVHQGFLNSYQIVQQNVSHAVKALVAAYPTATVAVFGHSLGAAIATVCAVDLTVQRLPVSLLVNWGCPRVFNPAAAIWAGSVLEAAGVVSWRTVNKRDPVPKIPLLSMSYTHLPHEVWLKNATGPLHQDIVECRDAIGREDLQCSFSVSVLDVVPHDHTTYFEVSSGCDVPPKL